MEIDRRRWRGESEIVAVEPLENVRGYYPAYQPGMRFDAPRDRFGAKYEEGMVGRFGLGCLLARRLLARHP